MKSSVIIIFISIVLSLYILLNTYLYIRVNTLSGISRYYLAPIFAFLVLAYPIARILEHSLPGMFSTILLWVGSFWLALMIYLFIFSILYEILNLIGIASYLKNFKKFWFILMISSSVLFILIGFFNANNPRIRHISIPMAVNQSFRITMASDLHFGTLMGKNRAGKILKMISDTKPDMIVFAGDVLDEDVGPAIRQNLDGLLSDLKAPYGVYAVTGNHEYYGGLKASIDFLQKNGVIVLSDSGRIINGQFFLAGRKDKEAEKLSKEGRLSVNELLKLNTDNLPVILLDHQPFGLQEIADAGVALSLSGHTHHAQLWPFQIITKWMFENSYGLIKKENTYIYVSCGAGTWGPAVRTSSRPEIVQIEIIPQNESSLRQ